MLFTRWRKWGSHKEWEWGPRSIILVCSPLLLQIHFQRDSLKPFKKHPNFICMKNFICEKVSQRSYFLSANLKQSKTQFWQAELIFSNWRFKNSPIFVYFFILLYLYTFSLMNLWNFPNRLWKGKCEGIGCCLQDGGTLCFVLNAICKSEEIK